jgi:hypothetical protein
MHERAEGFWNRVRMMRHHPRRMLGVRDEYGINGVHTGAGH